MGKSCGSRGCGPAPFPRKTNRTNNLRPAARRPLGLEEACQRLWAAGRVVRYLLLANQTMSAHIPLKTVRMYAPACQNQPTTHRNGSPDNNPENLHRPTSLKNILLRPVAYSLVEFLLPQFTNRARECSGEDLGLPQETLGGLFSPARTRPGGIQSPTPRCWGSPPTDDSTWDGLLGTRQPWL